MDVRGKVALITGASSGIGAATARAFAQRGARVIGVARRREALAAVIEACNRATPGAHAEVADLAEPGAGTRCVEAALAHHGRLDILVNNAGVPVRRHVCELTPPELERALRVNFLAAADATLAAIPLMLAQAGGAIVNVSSFAATVVPGREAAYAATKAAMNAFTEGLWGDLHDAPIQVVLLHAGPFDTEIWQKGEAPAGYRGPRHPPEGVPDAIFEALARGRREQLVPRWSPTLHLARWLRRLAPALVRLGTRRIDPVPAALLEAAAARGRVQLAARPGESPGSLQPAERDDNSMP